MPQLPAVAQRPPQRLQIHLANLEGSGLDIGVEGLERGQIRAVRVGQSCKCVSRLDGILADLGRCLPFASARAGVWVMGPGIVCEAELCL